MSAIHDDLWKLFTYIFIISFHNTISFNHFTYEKPGLERFINFPNVTQLANGRS